MAGIKAEQQRRGTLIHILTWSSAIVYEAQNGVVIICWNIGEWSGNCLLYELSPEFIDPFLLPEYKSYFLL